MTKKKPTMSPKKKASPADAPAGVPTITIRPNASEYRRIVLAAQAEHRSVANWCLTKLAPAIETQQAPIAEPA